MIPLKILPVLHHQTFTHEAQDGTLRAWDVTRGNQIAATGHPLRQFMLAEHEVTLEKVAQLYEGIDRRYAMTTDLSRPLLFIPFGAHLLLVDGWHRLWKAARLGVAMLPMYLLTQTEADSIQWLELPPGHGLPWK